MKASKSSFRPVVEKLAVLTVLLEVEPSPETEASTPTGGFGTVTVMPAVGVSRLRLSSTALLLILREPDVRIVQD
jgi:hypothetical protein